MKPKILQQHSATDEMLKYDFGVGVITAYQLKNNQIYFIMGEYHNKGALSPTAGGRFLKDRSIYDAIQDALERKRFGKMEFDSGDIDEKNIYYSINAKQNFARLTFVQNVEVNITEEDFKEKFVMPMHVEAQYQRSVSEFFWKLDETLKNSQYKFPSAEERALAAEKALNDMQKSHFPVGQEILNKLYYMADKNNIWNEKISPLKFYGDNGGRKYSEFTSFYLVSLTDIVEQLVDPEIKDKDKEKPTVIIKNGNFSNKKQFFIFEDEVKVFIEIVKQLFPIKYNPTLSKPASISEKLNSLNSLWTVEKINCDTLKVIESFKISNDVYSPGLMK